MQSEPAILGLDPAIDTLPRLAASAARRFGPDVAIRDGDASLTWLELDGLRLQVARSLVASGIEKGDRVAIWAPNSVEWIAAAAGLQTIGAVLVPLNTRFKAPEADDILTRSGAKLLFTRSGFLGTDYAKDIAAKKVEGLARIVEFGGATESSMGWADFLSEGEGVDPSVIERMAAVVTAEDPMDIMFTSGTTGRPKGAVFTHGQNIKCYAQYSEVWGLRRDDRYLIIPPFFHTFGYKMGWLSCMMAGCQMRPMETFDPAGLLPLIAQDGISVVTGPPTIFQSLLDQSGGKTQGLASLRLSMTGAAVVPVDLVRRMYSDLGFETVTVAYGMTECNGYVCCTRSDDDPELVARSVGIPLPDVEMRCVDLDGSALPPGVDGEVCLRGPMVMKGYFGDPEATADAIDSDGWYHSGDVGHFGEEGYLRITDRLKDMYISGGFNCYPAEIEKMLGQMDGIARVAVIGVPDARLGEVGKAFVIPEPNASLSEAGVIDWARSQMANYKVPRFVDVVDSLPQNASGKVLKTELRDKA